MKMQHDAIIALNSSIVRVVTKKATGQTIAYDDKGNEVSWDADAVATKEAELIAALKLENLFKAFFVTFSGLIAAFISVSMVLSLIFGLTNV